MHSTQIILTKDGLILQEKPHPDNIVSRFFKELLRLLCTTSAFFAQGYVSKTVPFVVRISGAADDSFGP